MEAWYALQIEFLTQVQNLGQWLLLPMQFFSFLGSEDFYLLVLPIIYWCIDSALGLRIALILLISVGLKDGLKMAFHAPRPYWYSQQIQPYAAENSFGIPSGHAQDSMSVWGLLPVFYRKRWLWVLAIGLSALIGFSRLFLGVHFPQDVLLGWTLGALVLWVFTRLWNPVVGWLKRKSLGVQVGSAFAASLLILLFGTIPYLGLQGWIMPDDWAANALRAGDGVPAPVSLSGILTSAATLFGLCAGLAWINLRGGYQAGGPWEKRLLCLLIGILGILVLRFGLGAIFPSGENLLAYAFRYLRYALIGAWVSAGAPLVFTSLKLSQADKP